MYAQTRVSFGISLHFQMKSKYTDYMLLSGTIRVYYQLTQIANAILCNALEDTNNDTQTWPYLVRHIDGQLVQVSHHAACALVGVKSNVENAVSYIFQVNITTIMSTIHRMDTNRQM